MSEKYTLHFLYRGWDEESHSDDLNNLIRIAKDLINNNTGKPLIITNNKDEIAREYTSRLHDFNTPKYSDDFKEYSETMKEIEELEE